MYRHDIDAYKGIAIIAVVLFHMGLLKSGYLGVDVFFVINGFLIIPSIIRRISSSEFSYKEFIQKRLYRLYPLVIIATTVCLLAGYIGMLPDNYENLCQAIVASNCMSENILSAITTHDYWNTVNEYNPLMHLWYVGILFEFYLLFPLILIAAKNLFKRYDGEKVCFNALLLCTGISFLLYITPISDANKFYFLQYRFFEIGLGGIIYYTSQRKQLNISILQGGG